MTLFIGIDPGPSTGLAAIKDGRKLLVLQGTISIAAGVLDAMLEASYDEKRVPQEEIYLALEKFIEVPRRAGIRRTQTPTDVGEFLAIANRHKHVTVVMQMPGDGHAVATPATMKKLGLHVVPSEVGQPDANDANSAMRHALRCMMVYRASLFEKLLSERGIV